MTTDAGIISEIDSKEQTDKRLELVRRYTLAGFADTSLFESIPNDVTLILLPDNDDDFVEREVRIGARIAQRGEDVYFRHVRTADLPD